MKPWEAGIHTLLEWISNSQMEALSIAERGDVEISTFTRIVGSVDADAPVKTHDKEIKVVAQPHARSQCSLVEQVRQSEFSFFHPLMLFGIPNIARIKEECTMKLAENLSFF